MIAYLKNMVDGTLELTERIVAYESHRLLLCQSSPFRLAFL